MMTSIFKTILGKIFLFTGRNWIFKTAFFVVYLDSPNVHISLIVILLREYLIFKDNFSSFSYYSRFSSLNSCQVN
jgi:hypothetical protein